MHRSIESYFLQWKASHDRLPLLVRGARQVGKTYVIEQFGSAHFDNVVKINFEQQREYLPCFETLYPQKILNLIYAVGGQTITLGKTLLFLDEIQECPQAILSLRYFYEQMPGLHIMAAGSLLEFTLQDATFRMPVGRIQSCYLKPLSFKEFLLATQKKPLVEYIEQVKINAGFEPALHDILLSHIKDYFVLGGMPAVIEQYLKTEQFELSQMRQTVILETYRRDFGKYTKLNDLKYLQALFDKAPGLIGQHFKYAQIDPHMLSRDIKRVLADLKNAGLIYTVHASLATQLPLISTIQEKKFKLLFLDIGLVNSVTQLSAEILMQRDLLLVHQGALAEQFVGQELLAYAPPYQETHLFYWEREKQSSTAEIDYVFSVDAHIFPIEVKAGSTGRLRSLQLFIEEKSSLFGLKISQKPLAWDKRVLSVPLYLVSELPRLVREGI
jgi:predicted AAA+ superfamily ATPase